MATDIAATATSAQRDSDLAAAVGFLSEGGVIAHPAEGVWGLACDHRVADAVQRIDRIKRRQLQPYILVFASAEQLFAQLPEAQAFQSLINAEYDHARSWLLASGWQRMPEWVRAGRESVVFRLTRHPLLQRLASSLGAALVSSSANIHGQPAPQSSDQIAPEVLTQVDYLLGGATLGQPSASQIYDLQTLQRLR